MEMSSKIDKILHNNKRNLFCFSHSEHVGEVKNVILMEGKNAVLCMLEDKNAIMSMLRR